MLHNNKYSQVSNAIIPGQGRCRHLSVALDDHRIIHVGGRDGKWTLIDTILLHDLRTDRITELPQPFVSYLAVQTYVDIVVCNGYIYLFNLDGFPMVHRMQIATLSDWETILCPIDANDLYPTEYMYHHEVDWFLSRLYKIVVDGHMLICFSNLHTMESSCKSQTFAIHWNTITNKVEKRQSIQRQPRYVYLMETDKKEWVNTEEEIDGFWPADEVDIYEENGLWAVEKVDRRVFIIGHKEIGVYHLDDKSWKQNLVKELCNDDLLVPKSVAIGKWTNCISDDQLGYGFFMSNAIVIGKWILFSCTTDCKRCDKGSDKRSFESFFLIFDSRSMQWVRRDIKMNTPRYNHSISLARTNDNELNIIVTGGQDEQRVISSTIEIVPIDKLLASLILPLNQVHYESTLHLNFNDIERAVCCFIKNEIKKKGLKQSYFLNITDLSFCGLGFFGIYQKLQNQFTKTYDISNHSCYKIISKCLKILKHENSLRLPIHVEAEYGLAWDEGMSILMKDAFDNQINWVDKLTGLNPYQLAASEGSNADLTTLYQMIRAYPAELMILVETDESHYNKSILGKRKIIQEHDI